MGTASPISPSVTSPRLREYPWERIFSYSFRQKLRIDERIRRHPLQDAVRQSSLPYFFGQPCCKQLASGSAVDRQVFSNSYQGAEEIVPVDLVGEKAFSSLPNGYDRRLSGKSSDFVQIRDADALNASYLVVDVGETEMGRTY